MAHVTISEILKNTKKEKFGIPCLAGSTLEMIIGIIKAAEDKNSPVIICYNKQLSPEIPIEISMPLIVNAAERSRVPVATILDHGSDFDLILKAIHYGSSSVMFDGSGLPFKENILKTTEIVKIAYALNVSVEAELDLELVRKISQLVDIPLVMHRASGLELETYKLIVESGISKINYFSAMCRGIYEKFPGKCRGRCILY